jgi:hypothetical protein
VHGEYLLINDGGDWQTIEAVGKRFPQLDVISPFTFIIKAVYAVNGGALVISAENEKILRVFDLICQKQTDGLQRLFTSIDIVA